MDGDCAKARRNDLSLGCGHREVSSVLVGDYFDDGSSQCHGSARCTASGEFDSCLESMIFCLTVLPALKSNRPIALLHSFSLQNPSYQNLLWSSTSFFQQQRLLYEFESLRSWKCCPSTMKSMLMSHFAVALFYLWSHRRDLLRQEKLAGRGGKLFGNALVKGRIEKTKTTNIRRKNEENIYASKAYKISH